MANNAVADHDHSDEEDSDELGDEDYCPAADSKRCEQLSSEESGNESDADTEAANKSKRSRKRKVAAEPESTPPPVQTSADAESAEKARADALWADFLSDETPKSQPTATAKKPNVEPISSVHKKTPPARSEPVSPPAKKQIVTETVEFAGEKIEITKEVAKAPTTATVSAKKTPVLPTSRRNPGNGSGSVSGGGGGGLSAILSQINKPKKIGTLEKSKLDWNGFKRAEGIEEQLQTHNRGKAGYLDRQDFLQRTDVRQFELEKDMRQTTRRSNK